MMRKLPGGLEGSVKVDYDGHQHFTSHIHVVFRYFVHMKTIDYLREIITY